MNRQLADFSGHWEKNYQRSDNVDSKFQLFIFDLQRTVSASANRGSMQGPSVSSGRGSNEAVIGLARITEDITKVALLEIEQDDNSIKVDREDSFSLTCDYYQNGFVAHENPFGSEVCGWYGDQLIFQIKMRDGLSIYHQLTLGPDRQELNITTTVTSNAVSAPFTISNYYHRYTPPELDYECIFTLSRNNVCSQNGLL